MSNFRVLKYTCSPSVSSHINAQIGLSTSMVASNKVGRIAVGNIVAVVNSVNNIVQLAKVVSKEFHAQPWAVDYKHCFNVEFIAKDILVSDDDKKMLQQTGQHMTKVAQEAFVKTVITNWKA